MSVITRCARPGCGAEAAAWLSYDYAGQRVWLDDCGVDVGGHRCALCPAHASRLRAPQGWSFQDRRTGQPHAPLPPRAQRPPQATLTSGPPPEACSPLAQPSSVPVGEQAAPVGPASKTQVLAF